MCLTCVLTDIEMTNIGVGSILSVPSAPMHVTSRIRARVVIFNFELPSTSTVSPYLNTFVLMRHLTFKKSYSKVEIHNMNI